MFYRALGFAVWKLAKAELQRRYGRRARLAGLAAVLSILVAAYLATRSSSE
jgi:hypothetical protein